jgi:hypothetical protein
MMEQLDSISGVMQRSEPPSGIIAQSIIVKSRIYYYTFRFMPYFSDLLLLKLDFNCAWLHFHIQIQFTFPKSSAVLPDSDVHRYFAQI